MKKEGFEVTLTKICKKMVEIQNSKQKAVIVNCLDLIANADGVVHTKELAVKKRLMSVLEE